MVVAFQIWVVEDIIKTKIIQVVIDLINKKYNTIIARNLVIVHMNARRSIMNKEGESKTSQATPTLH